jgi:hypothetical protein
VTQICAFTLQWCRTDDANLRINTRYILNYAVHGACLRMVLLTDVYRNVISLRVNRLRICYKFLKKQSIKVELECLEPGNGGLNNLNARSATCYYGSSSFLSSLSQECFQITPNLDSFCSNPLLFPPNPK